MPDSADGDVRTRAGLRSVFRARQRPVGRSGEDEHSKPSVGPFGDDRDRRARGLLARAQPFYGLNTRRQAQGGLSLTELVS